jgi:glycosyltransferase involved in cell wall biosynthesis
LDPYILPDIFPIINKTRHRISIERFNPIFPSVDNKKPLIIHSPSKINAKGTPAVLSAIEQLKDKYDFEFQLIHNMPYQQANELLRNCDIFLDQFVLGAHGVAALEAMAYGKPTVCYIKPSQINQYPPELPIVNANKENLPETLSMLLDNAQLRNDIGKQGRAYIEKYHDTDKICRELISLYESI